MKIRSDNRSLRKSESNRIFVEKTILKSNVDAVFSLQNLKVESRFFEVVFDLGPLARGPVTSGFRGGGGGF